MRKFNAAMMVVWVAMGLVALAALANGIFYDWGWVRASRQTESVATPRPDRPSPAAGRVPSGMILYKQESYALSEIDTLSLQMGMEDVVVRYGDADTIVVSQYGEEGLSEKRIAEMDWRGSSLNIHSPSSRENRLGSWNKDSQLEILLPADFSGRADFSVSMGELTLEESWNFEELALQVSMGDLRCKGAIGAKSADIDASMGEISLESLESDDFTVRAGAGSIKIRKLSGSGEVECNMGEITVGSLTLSGALSLNASMGDITVSIEQGQSFTFEGKTSMGDIDAYFLTEHSGGINRNVSATVGDGPYVPLEAESNMGSISIKEA